MNEPLGPLGVDPASPAETAAVERPADIPEKFWDTATNSVRVDDLAKSYRELERHLGGSVKIPGASADEADIAKFRQALGVPETADAYELQLGVNPGAKRGQLPVEYWATFRDQDCVWARVLTT